MKSHFTLGNRSIEFVPPSTQPAFAKSRQQIGYRAAIACVVAGTAAMMAGVCSGQIAFDSATDPVYAAGWHPGQNGGYGFGAWSFNATDPTPPGKQYQAINSPSPIGTEWTLMTYANSTGLANAGRSIIGGLNAGELFETVIENPGSYHFFRGFDILFTGGPDNNVPGDNTAALRLSVFNYGGSNWNINDTGSHPTPVPGPVSAIAGMKIDLALTSPTTYALTMTPLNGAPVYMTTGTLAGPISYVNFREWNGTSAGPSNVPENFGISYVEVTAVPEPASLALVGLGAAGLMFFRRRK
jgi:hypothetical protein